MAAVAHEKGGQRVALHIRVVGKNARSRDDQRHIFRRGVGVVVGHGRVVHGCNVDGDRGEIAVGGAVVGAIGESVAAVVVGGRKVSETAIGIEIQHSMTDVTYEHRSQRVALHIRVVGKNAGGGDGQTNVFQRGISVFVGDGRVVHGRNVDGDGGEIGVGGAVVGAVGESVAAVVVGGREVSEAAVGVESQSAMSDVTYEHRGQRVALHIRVVGKNARSRDDQRHIFRRGVIVVVGDGRVVHGRNVDGDGGEIAVGGAVVGAVGESVAAVVVGGREVSEATVGVEIQHSMTDVTYKNCGQRVALHIRVVGKNAGRGGNYERHVFQRNICVVVGHGRVIHGNNGDRHRAGGRSGAIGNGVVENHRAVEICGGRENNVGAADDGSAVSGGSSDDGQGQAIGIVVVGENFDGHTRVFQRIGAVINSDHRIIYRGDIDGECGEIAVGGAVVGAVGESVAAVVVGGREVSEAAIGVEIQHSMTDVTYEHRGQRVALHIRVVGKNARSHDGQRDVFESRVSIIDGDGRVVHGNDVDRHGGRIGQDGLVDLKPHVFGLIAAIEIKRPVRIGVATGVFNENPLTGLVIQVQIVGRSCGERPKGCAINDHIRLE